MGWRLAGLRRPTSSRDELPAELRSIAQLGSTRAVSGPGSSPRRLRVVSPGETCSKLGGTAPNEAFVIPDSTREKANLRFGRTSVGCLADKDLAPPGNILD